MKDLPKTIRKRLPNYPLPALRLARLAVAASAQGQGIGKQLLKAVFRIAHRLFVPPTYLTLLKFLQAENRWHPQMDLETFNVKNRE